ncbi:NERD domain-containing protein [Filobacillus milosensis]|uniref:NERD domain-containing protein n=1 Tax=Filobacillus milosensis TaxID=94137 RepID=A0A4Y8INE5_9BACI|nr:nuclease-related domain-containing protein [Filobacillus milosensis]TFB22947.1 NERD domain-containing protein [Filobacillus milosensis]
MIAKDHDLPVKLWRLEALSRRCIETHSSLSDIEEKLRVVSIGDRGERSMDYYVNLVDDETLQCFYDLRLPWRSYYFQMDTVLLRPQFILIVEVKNISGDLYFNKDTKQMIRVLKDVSESFPNPLLQVSHHKFQLENYLQLHGFLDVPIYSLVVSASRNGILRIDANDTFHLGKVVPIQEFIFKYQNLCRTVTDRVLSCEEMVRMKDLFLRDHTPNNEDLMKKFGLVYEDLKKGVRCKGCGYLPVDRKWGTWYCLRCDKGDRNAHIGGLRDYSLLVNETISNSEAQDFLAVKNREVIKQIFKNLQLPRTGVGKGTRYNLSKLIKSP